MGFKKNIRMFLLWKTLKYSITTKFRGRQNHCNFAGMKFRGRPEICEI